MSLSVFFQKVRPEAKIPQYAHTGDAGMDLCACAPIMIPPGERALVPTGLSIALPFDTEAQVRPRSGLAVKHGITVLNSPGTIDAGYRGEIGVILINFGKEPFSISIGMRIAQLVIAPVLHPSVQCVERLPESDRGAGGFGSTGV